MRHLDRTPPAKGRVYLAALPVDGSPPQLWHHGNLVVNQGRQEMARLWASDPDAAAPAKIGLGTNGAASTPAHTGLTGAAFLPLRPSVAWIEGVAVPFATRSAAGFVASFGFTVEPAEAVGLDIRELGLLADDNRLLARWVIDGGITKTSALRLAGVWQIEF